MLYRDSAAFRELRRAAAQTDSQEKDSERSERGGSIMRALRSVLLVALLAAPLALARPAQAQVAVGIGIGPAGGVSGAI